jgi:hypothetical protein
MLFYQLSNMKKEAEVSSEMFVHSYQTSRHLTLKEIKLTFRILLVCHCSDMSHILLVVVACSLGVK